MTAHVIPAVNPDLDQAREYLAKVLPWPVPGEEGYVTIGWTFDPGNLKPDKTGKIKYPWTNGHAVRTVDEAIGLIK